MEELKKVFDFCKSTIWHDKTPGDIVCQQAKIAVSNLLEEQNYTKNKKIYRIAGQSGSGKTTQLVPAIIKLEKIKGNNPIIISVRNFVKYHPCYDKILASCKIGNIRERTNGFALKCLCAAFKLIIEQGYLIILEVTILDTVFEDFINKQIQDNDYNAEYHILAVNKKLSDFFIEKRKNDITSAENGKIVKKESKNYFYDILPIGIDYLKNTDKKSVSFVWTAFDKKPIYQGTLDGAVNALETGRELFKQTAYTEAELRQAKIQYLTKFHKINNV